MGAGDHMGRDPHPEGIAPVAPHDLLDMAPRGASSAVPPHMGLDKASATAVRAPLPRQAGTLCAV